jgi:arylsulfatase A-like enzyme
MSHPRAIRVSVIARTAGAFALAALVAGSVHAALVIWPRTWVREFQAGPPSGWLEKLGAIVQSAAIEGTGFLAVGLFLALAALGLARALPWLRAEGGSAGYGGALVLCAGAFFGWAAVAWIAEDALAFLTRAQLLALDAAGFLVLLAALSFFDLLTRSCSRTPRPSEASALGSVVGASLGTWMALKVVKSGEQGWREPTLLALAVVTYLAAVPLAAVLAWALARPALGLRERLRRGPLVPLGFRLAGWAGLALAGAWTVLHLELSPLAGPPSYATLAPRPEGPGPNVVLVTVDTLRADHLGCYGYPRPTSPFLDGLAREGTLFRDASASAAWTKPATGTILTGLHPSRHGALYHGSLLHVPEGERTLAEAFREHGYVTAGFVANPNLKKVFAFDRGFDAYFDAPVEDTLTLACIRGTWFGRLLMELLRHQFNWNYENDVSRMNREVLAWLEKNSHQRFFLYAHYIDPHIPYDPPARYREEFEQAHGLALFNERKRLVGIDRYDGEIRYTDDGLRELVEKLRQLGAWENTLFVLTSDHGEEFFEHGVLGHGFSLYQEVVRVPLVLRGPSVPAGVVVEAPVQILDLAASLLDLAGTGVDELGDGRSFLGRIRTAALGSAAEPSPEFIYLESEFGQDESDPRAFVFSGLRMGPWKLVLTERNQFFPPADPRYGREALYDLASDPAERRNLFREDEHQALIEGLLGRLRGHAEFLAEHGFRDVPPAVLTPEVEAELRALGYIGGQ